MRNFIDKQIELHIKATDKLRAIKQAQQLLRANPTSGELLSMKAALQIEYFEIMMAITKDYIKDEKTNVVDHGTVTLATDYFNNN